MLSTPSELPTVESRMPHSAQAQDGERCRNCGSALARDQRYCINCGKPSTETRKPLVAAPVAAPAAAARSGAITPGIAAAGICLSLLFLATGLIAGRNSSSTVSAPAPVAPIVVRVNGNGGTADTSAATTDSASTPTATSKASVTPKLSAADKAKAAQAQTQLNNLGKATGKAYQEGSAKLPKQYVTPGKLPPPKPGQAGGGSSDKASFG